MRHDSLDPTQLRAADNVDLALDTLRATYQDARSRSNSLRASALVSLGLLSAFAALAGPADVAALGWWGLPTVVFPGVGLLTALAVMLPTLVSVPYDARLLGDARFISAEIADAKERLIGPLVGAESDMRHYNKWAAWLVNVSLASFVMGVVILSFQVGLGAKRGLLVGFLAAALMVALAFVGKYLASPARKSTGKKVES